ncbi:hypothetical protein RFI_09908 [Reticulomyxa filosa]|uniref:Uncharacterized protein n=1 Tax=Reticulomyxa filosa TaxID=46433 RepID=X6NMI1_RETFI|nr:hypothetical protein RFI_09908 [Reticulomyxa filosa]|eukprot:ETO27226.1 hypothetical protein RFI_09908 [Reticulomyxa filosa]
MNSYLLEGYWDMMKTLVRVETLRHIDLLLPDPHLLLVADIIKQSAFILSETTVDSGDAKADSGNDRKVEKINNGRQIKFKPIQIRPDSFFVYSTNLKFLKFAVKSLTPEQLLKTLDHLFTYYYLNYDNADLMGEFAHLADRYTHEKIFKTSRVYKYCASVIRRPMLFDIFPAMSNLNYNQCVTLEELHLVDIRCSKKDEMKRFLENNYNKLQTIVLQYTAACLQCETGTDVTTSSPKLGSSSSALLLAGNETMSGTTTMMDMISDEVQSPTVGNSQEHGTESTKKRFDKNTIKVCHYINEQVSAIQEFLSRAAQHQKRKNARQGRFQKFALENVAISLPQSGLSCEHLPALRDLFDTLSQGCSCKKSSYTGRQREKEEKEENGGGGNDDDDGEEEEEEEGQEEGKKNDSTGFNGNHSNNENEFSHAPECEAVIQLDKLHISGLMSSFEFHESVDWTKMLQAQQTKQVIIKNFIYQPSVFASFVSGFATSVVRLDLQLQFEEAQGSEDESNEWKSKIKGAVLFQFCSMCNTRIIFSFIRAIVWFTFFF